MYSIYKKHPSLHHLIKKYVSYVLCRRTDPPTPCYPPCRAALRTGRGGGGWESHFPGFGMVWGIAAAWMGRWMGGGMGEGCGVQVPAQGARRAGIAWVAGVPMTLASGHADKGCLQSPELAPSECCPQLPPRSLSCPLGASSPQQLSRSMGRIPGMQSPWRACHLPGAMQLVPIHGLGVSRVPSAGTRSQQFPWQAQEQQAGDATT